LEQRTAEQPGKITAAMRKVQCRLRPRWALQVPIDNVLKGIDVPAN